ncbi:class II SORL domain-containing protein [bacterium]|nr:class II SORL domain-containing protein [bacterium]
MKRREIIKSSAILAGAAFTAGNVYAADAQGGGDRFGSVIISPDKEMGKEKHVPVIDAPAAAKIGEPFNVTVTVGKVVPHPNTVEHHIKWIHLYAKEEGSQYAVDIARVDFGATVAQPSITVPVMLQKDSTLYAVEHCNIHGLWDYSVKVKVS